MLIMNVMISLVMMIKVGKGAIEPPSLATQGSSGFNLLLGMTPFEQRRDLIGSPLFSFTNLNTNDDVGRYIKYDQVKEISDISSCKWEGISNFVSWGTSSQTLESQASSSSNGIDIRASIGIEYLGVSVDTEVRNALIFGNSQTSIKQFSQKDSGLSYTFDATATRFLYTVELDYDNINTWSSELLSAIQSLGNNPSNSDVVGFFQEFGSHGLLVFHYGQTCITSAFMEEGYSITEYYSYRESVENNEAAFLWWTSSSSNSESDSDMEVYESSFSYQHANRYCTGELATDSSCSGGMSGTGVDSPQIIKWTYKPIWEMDIPQFHVNAKTRMKAVFEDIVDAGIDCRSSCSNHGSCAADLSVWVSKSTAQSASNNFANFWDDDKCFCDDTRVGDFCEERAMVAISNPIYPSAWQNDWDGLLSYYENGYAFCGIQSYHDNQKEDRKYKFAKCRPTDNRFQTTVGGIHKMVKTNYDSRWRRECELNKLMVWVYSFHDNSKEDRRFEFGCQKFKDIRLDQGSCFWSTNWINNFDATFKEECPSGYMLAGIESYHANQQEDRRFKLKCCQLIVDDTRYISIIKSDWTNYQNGWDDFHESWASIDSRPGAICGVSSYHDNDKEDRRFRFKYCRPSDGSWTVGSMEYLGYSSWDTPFNFQCSNNRVLHYWKSYHDNDKEDRRYRFGCLAFESFKRELCITSHYVNTWDQTFDFQCGSGYVIAGVESYHDNDKEDRRFQFKCCKLSKNVENLLPSPSFVNVIKQSGWTDYVNGWDSFHSTWATFDSKPAAFCGVSSYHDNGKEDRRYRFKYCRLSDGTLYDYSARQYLPYTSYDASWRRTCANNKVLRLWESSHNNDKEDRKFKFTCDHFGSATTQICYWSSYVNSWDGSFNFECRSQYVITGVESYHDNYREDRRFKFKCCRWIKK